MGLDDDDFIGSNSFVWHPLPDCYAHFSPLSFPYCCCYSSQQSAKHIAINHSYWFFFSFSTRVFVIRLDSFSFLFFFFLLLSFFFADLLSVFGASSQISWNSPPNSCSILQSLRFLIVSPLMNSFSSRAITLTKIRSGNFYFFHSFWDPFVIL